MMHNQHLSTSIQGNKNVRIWTHGEFPMPHWVPQHMAGGIEPNGTFMLATELGRARVHLANVIIERYGIVWVRAIDEAPDFVEGAQDNCGAAKRKCWPWKDTSIRNGRPHKKQSEKDHLRDN